MSSRNISEEYDSLLEQFYSIRKELDLEDLNSKRIIERHIRDLKEYNELRDTGLRLVQIVSDDKKVSLKTIVEEIGYSIKDD